MASRVSITDAEGAFAANLSWVGNFPKRNPLLSYSQIGLGPDPSPNFQNSKRDCVQISDERGLSSRLYHGAFIFPAADAVCRL